MFLKLKIFVWYFIRPKYFKHSIRLVIKFLFIKNKKIINKKKLYNEFNNYLISLDEFFINNFNTSKIIKNNIKYVDYKNNNLGGGSNIDLIFNITELSKSKLVLETGVAYGYSSLFFLKSLKKRNGKLISINLPYPDTKKEKYIGKAVTNDLFKYWKLYSGADKDLLPKILRKNNSFDIFHYDSDKSYHGKIWALNLVWPYITKNGFLICDDIQDNFAFIDFTKIIKKDPVIINYNNKFIGIVKKI